jgi:hypothetical protein
MALNRRIVLTDKEIHTPEPERPAGAPKSSKSSRVGPASLPLANIAMPALPYGLTNSVPFTANTAFSPGWPNQRDEQVMTFNDLFVLRGVPQLCNRIIRCGACRVADTFEYLPNTSMQCLSCGRILPWDQFVQEQMRALLPPPPRNQRVEK